MANRVGGYYLRGKTTEKYSIFIAYVFIFSSFSWFWEMRRDQATLFIDWFTQMAHEYSS
jgi:hypothetical protein